MPQRHKDPEYHKKWWAKNKHKYKNRETKRTDPDYQKNWYLKNKERKANEAKEERRNNPEKALYKSCKYSSKRRGIDFDLELSDIIIPDICPILKKPLKPLTRYAPTVDRIDNSLGYVKGNVWVISRKANTMKLDADSQELKLFADWVINNYIPVNLEELRC